MKILQLADIHARDKDIDEIKKCLEFIVETAKAETPDIIINAGDTFDSSLIKADSQSAKMIFRVFQELANIAPVAIIIGTKSHDGQTAEILRYIKAKYPIHVSTRPEQLYLCEGDIGIDPHMPGSPQEASIEAIISMVPAPDKSFFQSDNGIVVSEMEIAQAMSVLFGGFAAQAQDYAVPHILVGHWNTTGALVSETQTLTGVDIELSKDQMAMANADLVCLGHIHKAQDLGDGIFYSGSITALNWGEMEDKGVYMHGINTDMGNPNRKDWSIASRFIKTPSKTLLRISEDLTKDGYGINDLVGTVVTKDLKDTYIKIEAKVFQDEVKSIDKEKIKDFFLSVGAKEVTVDLIVIPRENVRSQILLQLKTLSEKLIEQARLREEAVPDSILVKAALIETGIPENIIKQVGAENV